MNVLVIGSGGREHALAWKASQSSSVSTVYVAPGNAGTAMERHLENVAISVADFTALADFAENNNVGLTIVGPEQPLVDGIVDYFQSRGLAIFGPSSDAAQLEGSKAFTKDFLERQQIPTANYGNFTEVDAALEYLQQVGAPIVVKADGLAAGKGVIVAMTMVEAEGAVRDMLAGNAFGEAGSRVVIEEFLDGEEASFIVMVDGVNVLPMATSQDHKRAGNGDIGPNTGGMGAYSPSRLINNELEKKILKKIIDNTLKLRVVEDESYYVLNILPEPKYVEFDNQLLDTSEQINQFKLDRYNAYYRSFVDLNEVTDPKLLFNNPIFYTPSIAASGRIYHTIASMPKYIRESMRAKPNELIWEVDMCSAQPSIVFLEWLSFAKKNLQISINDEYMLCLKLLLEGGIYKYIQDNSTYFKELKYDKLKKNILSALYAENKPTESNKELARLFPNVMQWVNNIKKESGYKTMSLIGQSIEAKIFVEVSSVRLVLLPQTFPFFLRAFAIPLFTL